MQKIINHYIFTSQGEPIKIELNLATNMARVDGKYISIEKLEVQLKEFLNNLNWYKKQNKGESK